MSLSESRITKFFGKQQQSYYPEKDVKKHTKAFLKKLNKGLIAMGCEAQKEKFYNFIEETAGDLSLGYRTAIRDVLERIKEIAEEEYGDKILKDAVKTGKGENKK